MHVCMYASMCVAGQWSDQEPALGLLLVHSHLCMCVCVYVTYTSGCCYSAFPAATLFCCYPSAAAVITATTLLLLVVTWLFLLLPFCYTHTHTPHTHACRHLQVHCTSTTCRSSYHNLSSTPSYPIVATQYYTALSSSISGVTTPPPLAVKATCVCFKWFYYTPLHLQLMPCVYILSSVTALPSTRS